MQHIYSGAQLLISETTFPNHLPRDDLQWPLQRRCGSQRSCSKSAASFTLLRKEPLVAMAQQWSSVIR